MTEKICKMSLELARINNNNNNININNNYNKSGGDNEDIYNKILDPVTLKSVSLFSNEGKAILKNLIAQYKRLT